MRRRKYAKAVSTALWIVFGSGCAPGHSAVLHVDSHCDSSFAVTGFIILHNNDSKSWSIDTTGEWQGQLQVFQSGRELLNRPGEKDIWAVPSTQSIASGDTWTSPDLKLWDGMLSNSPPTPPDNSSRTLSPVRAPKGEYTISIQVVDEVDAHGNATYISTTPAAFTMPGCAASQSP